MGIRRYPGALPFNSKQEKIFYGRGKDINKLLTLIQVEKQVLLYSKSGLGKTSLLEAGVIPKLPAQFIPISIRFYAHTEGAQTPVERVVEALKNKITDFEKRARTVLDELIQDDDRYKTLWYYFKNLQLTNEVNDEKQANNIYLLVFDQFEELFTYPDEQANEFKNQFYELSQLDVPGSIVRLMVKRRRDPENPIENETISLLQQEIDVKTVFAIRSDRLSLLNRLSDKLPDIQLNYHVLYPLDADQTKNAIVKPALDEDEKFETSPFEYDPKAVDKIVSELTKEGSEKLETTQLQIVCQRIEDDVNKKYKSVSNGEKVVVHVKDLPDFSNIFDEFYTNSIDKIKGKEQQLAARRLIEGKLISKGQRISLDENSCKQENVTEVTLKKLVDTHLLRAERNSFERLSYELSHDTLVGPIQKYQKKYLKKQADEKAKKKKRTQRLITRIVSVFAIFLIGVTVVAWILYLDADEAWEEAEINRKVAVEASRRDSINLEKLKETQYYINSNDGDEFMGDAKYLKAITKFRNALNIKYSNSSFSYKDSVEKYDYHHSSKDSVEKYDSHLHKRIPSDRTWESDSDTAQLKINTCNDRIEKDSIYVNSVRKADSSESVNDYVTAMRALNEALSTEINNTLIGRKRNTLMNKAKNTYELDIKEYNEWGDTIMPPLIKIKFGALTKLYDQ